MASPLLGYNTNVRHLGKLYHIQTEDSGASHGHLFTHLFADGGRIIASKKTTYAHHIGTDRYPEVVKKLMRESHKAMFIALRDGRFDGDEAAGARFVASIEIRVEDEAIIPDIEVVADIEIVDDDALERAAAARLAEAKAQQAPRPRPPPPPPPAATKYATTRPAVTPTASTAARRPDPATESIFGSDLLSEKSLDEVILSYLAEDMDEES